MISKTSGYAIRSLTYIALNSSKTHKIGIHELSKELDVPQPFLAKILQVLIRHNIISSTKDPHGGFYTNQLTLDTTALTVVDIIEGLGLFSRCILALPECSGDHPCPMHAEVVAVRNKLQEVLEQLTFKDLMKEVVEGHSFLKTC